MNPLMTFRQLGLSLSSVWLRSLCNNERPLCKYSLHKLIVNCVGFTRSISVGFTLNPAFRVLFSSSTFRYSSSSVFWWWYNACWKKGVGTYIRCCGYCMKAVRAWWMHCWCVWSLSAFADSVWWNTEKAHDVPVCGWKSDTPSTNKCHSICPPDCYLQSCLTASAFCVLWASLQMMSPQTKPHPDHRISSTSSHPLKCSCKGLELPFSKQA